jgi:DNA-binding HxlR family transcriptional regulator
VLDGVGEWIAKARSDDCECSDRHVVACILQATDATFFSVPGKPDSKHRSGCPVSISLDIFGDRWSLLIVRDLMVRGLRTFREFQESGEGIATNILADRLRKLEASGIICPEAEKTDGRRLNYRLTQKGIDLAPVLLEMLIWGARYEAAGPLCARIAKIADHREEFLAEVRRRWRERDTAPLLPARAEADTSQGGVRTTRLR